MYVTKLVLVSFRTRLKLVHLFTISHFCLYVYVTKYSLIASYLVEFGVDGRLSVTAVGGRHVLQLVQLTDDAWRISLTAEKGRGEAVTTRERSTVSRPTDEKWCLDISVPLINRDSTGAGSNDNDYSAAH